MSEKLLNLLGLMRKAGSLETGETNAGAVCRGGKAKLLLLASDASENARRRAESFVQGRSTVFVTVPFTKDEIASKVGTSVCSMAAITDLGFADAFMKGLCSEFPDKYSVESRFLSEKLIKTKRRKTEKGTLKNKQESIREE